ncbi:cytochrome P450 [Methylopila sp. M107]|uniref:cytochrome P450 n=1 Tax=Methylopila sp. M107 TaxID=1101190 RepID=UPI00037A2095|nr:cytochrome P450 [Methylopila sp. M107]
MRQNADQADATASVVPAMLPRHSKPLSMVAALKAASHNSLSFCDEELFDRLIVSRRYGLQRVVFVSDPAGVKHVLLDRFDNYPRWSSSRRLFEKELRTGTLSSEGEVWRRHRRVATPTIDVRSVSGDIPKLIKIAEARANKLHVAAREGRVVDLQGWLSRYAAMMWNHVVSSGDPDGLDVINWLARVPHRPSPIDLVPKPKWLHDMLTSAPEPESIAANAKLDRLIATRRDPAYAGPKDLIWRIIHAVDRESNEPLPPSEARDEAASLINGGVATVRAMTWIWYLLALHPEVEERLHAEVDAVTGGRPIQPDDIQKLRYGRQILDETLRLYPPIPAILRESVADDVICGEPVKAGSFVLVMPWLIHRHRKLWSDPDLYDPERFGPGMAAQRQRYAYLPFAAGPRVCVASAFALTQLMITISVLARRFRFRLAPDRPIVPAGSVSLRVDGGLHVTVERRR